MHAVAMVLGAAEEARTTHAGSENWHILRMFLCVLGSWTLPSAAFLLHNVVPDRVLWMCGGSACSCMESRCMP